MPEHTQGSYANSSGNTLEQTIIAVFYSKGFEIVSWRELRDKPEDYGSDLLIRNVPFKSIYGHDSRSEFVAVSTKYNMNIRIECKWQQSNGSVDEKFPYLYLNCIERMPEENIFIIVGGGGAKAGAIEWLKDAAQKGLYLPPDSKKFIRVMTLEDFITWANRAFREAL